MSADTPAPYQLLPPLRAEELAALEADIRKRGVLVPVEVDENGVILDGHNRVEIAQRFGLPYQTIVREFTTEQERREHVLKVNLCRRHLGPIQWGIAFQRLLEAKGVRTGRGARNDATSATIADVAEELGVPTRTAEHRLAQARVFEELPADDRARVEAGEVTLQQVKREQKEQARQAHRDVNRKLVEEAPSVEAALGAAKFSTILIDPPWDPGDEGEDDGEGLYGRGRPTYATLRLESLTALPVGHYADADAHLYLWITNRSLFKGEILLDSWGFRYVTCITWCKPYFGLGSYFRGQTEHILFGVKGSQPLKRRDVGTWFLADRGPQGHSSKPIEMYDLIESCSPGPYLELFARHQRPGWVCWGAEVTTDATMTEGTAL